MKTILYPVLSSFFLAACTLPGIGTPSAWQAEQAFEDFTAEGRLAVEADGKGYHAGFDWSLQNGVETININTPLGNTLGQLCRDEKGVLAVNAAGEVLQAQTAEELSRRLLGFSLPLQYLNVWANGYRTQSLPHEITADGSLLQGGWRISRHTDRQGAWRSLTVENNTLSLRLAFSSLERGTRPDATAACEARGGR
ncbi:MAG: outer membrane lipoprotein LolB [Neisseria sp.]|nr:outer membrane lipoprotein LolB [Neisseria sp.]